MPELPEVEIVCRNLSKMLKPNDKIVGWSFFRKDLRFEIPKSSLKLLVGKPLLSIRRRAKYIIFDFGKYLMISHLGMTGSWREEERNWPRKKHDHLAFEVSPSRFFVFEDPRRFGFIEVIEKSEEIERFKDLGVEPLNSSVDFNELTAVFKLLNSPIKSALMNQKLVVGIGNIYASEILFRVGVNPLKKCSKVQVSDYTKIWKESEKVLKAAILAGGSTIENYRNSFGERGNFQSKFFVYGREGEECLKCHTLIKSEFLSGRNTFWCSKCQKK
jgi:formamidopyrimidine-DNA glycosylase